MQKARRIIFSFNEAKSPILVNPQLAAQLKELPPGVVNTVVSFLPDKIGPKDVDKFEALGSSALAKDLVPSDSRGLPSALKHCSKSMQQIARNYVHNGGPQLPSQKLRFGEPTDLLLEGIGTAEALIHEKETSRLLKSCLLKICRTSRKDELSLAAQIQQALHQRNADIESFTRAAQKPGAATETSSSACPPRLEKEQDCALLRLAASRGMGEVVRLLLAVGADANSRGHEPIFWAALNGHRHVVQQLANDVDEPAQNEALRGAACGGQAHLVRELLDGTCASALKADTNDGDLDAVRTPLPRVTSQEVCNDALLMAAVGGHVEVVQTLLPHVTSQEARDKAFKKAAEAGRVEVVQTLLPLVTSQEVRDAAFIMAAGSGEFEVLEVLLEHVTDQVIYNDAFSKAARRGALNALQTLLPYVADQEKRNDALVEAATAGHLEVVSRLLGCVTCQKSRNSAFVNAAQGGHAEVVLKLRDHVSEEEVRKCAFALAVAHKWPKTAELLAAHVPKATVNKVFDQAVKIAFIALAKTAVDETERTHCISMVEKLANHVDSKTHRAALKMARDNWCREIIRVLSPSRLLPVEIVAAVASYVPKQIPSGVSSDGIGVSKIDVFMGRRGERVTPSDQLKAIQHQLRVVGDGTAADPDGTALQVQVVKDF